MNYVNIINLIFLIISTLFTIYIFHFLFFGISGVVHKRKYPKSEEKCRYGIIIPCKDEENVVSRLIQSIKSSNYPQDKLDIFVIAHNCIDKTAEIAKSLGAKVIVCNDKSSDTLGKAYNYAFKHIDNITSYDGFIFLNADNTVEKDYFDKLNDAFIYYKKKDTISTFRHSLNIDKGVLPAAYGLYFGTSCLLCFSGRNNFNVSGRITGCGFVVPASDLVNGWNYLSVTEDVEFSADHILNNKHIRYCDEATFYDEQPRKLKLMWNQRLRWAKGQNIISRKYFFKLLKALFLKEHKNKMSLYVSMTFHSLPTLVVIFMTLTQALLLLLSPIFGISIYDAFLYWNPDVNWFTNIFASFNTGFLFILLRNIAFFFIGSYLTATGVLIAGRKKYKGHKISNIIFAYLLFPLFLGLQFPLDLVAMFKKVKWQKIPHGVD